MKTFIKSITISWPCEDERRSPIYIHHTPSITYLITACGIETMYGLRDVLFLNNIRDRATRQTVIVTTIDNMNYANVLNVDVYESS